MKLKMKMKKTMAFCTLVMMLIQMLPASFAADTTIEKTALNYLGLPEVTATLMSTKIMLNGVDTSIRVYDIDGRAYAPFAKVYHTFKKAKVDFNANIYIANALGLNTISYYGIPKETPATQIATPYNRPLICNGDLITYNFIGYKMDTCVYYPLDEIMNLIDCGLIIDEKNNVVNLDTSKKYEAPFEAIPKGDAAYTKLQQELYDAYFEGYTDYISIDSKLNVPDGATLYVPRDVRISTDGAGKIYVGNNATFYVNGDWREEYPDRCLFSAKKDTVGALYINKHLEKPQQIRLFQGGFDYSQIDIPLKTAKLSYLTNEAGIDDIFIDFTREENDIKRDLGVILYERNGATYEFLYKNVDNHVNITNDLAKLIGEKVGQNTEFTGVYVYNYDAAVYGDKIFQEGSDNTITGILKGNNAIIPEPIMIPIEWRVETSGNGPVVDDTYKAIYSRTEKETRIDFEGLSSNTFIAKYDYNYVLNVEAYAQSLYALLMPNDGYKIRHIDFLLDGDIHYRENQNIASDHANIATISGKKAKAENVYDFKVSQFSNDIFYSIDKSNPIEGNVTQSEGKTFLNMKDEATKTKKIYMPIMIMADTKASSGSKLEAIYQGSMLFEYGVGKLDITSYIDESKYEEPILYFFQSTITNMDRDNKKSIRNENGLEVNLNTLQAVAKVVPVNKKSDTPVVAKPVVTVKEVPKTFIAPHVIVDEKTGLKFDLTTGLIMGYTKDLEKFVMPSTIQGVTVSGIGFNAFSGSNMKSIVIPSSVENIGDQPFAGCIYLKSVKLTKGLKTIGAYAFSYCLSLTSIELPEGLTTLDQRAFNDCENLETIKIPSSVVNIGQDVFSNTAWLAKQPKPVIVNGIDVLKSE